MALSPSCIGVSSCPRDGAREPGRLPDSPPLSGYAAMVAVGPSNRLLRYGRESEAAELEPRLTPRLIRRPRAARAECPRRVVEPPSALGVAWRGSSSGRAVIDGDRSRASKRVVLLHDTEVLDPRTRGRAELRPTSSCSWCTAEASRVFEQEAATYPRGASSGPTICKTAISFSDSTAVLLRVTRTMSGGGNFVMDGGGAAALSPFPALQPAHPVIERLEVSARGWRRPSPPPPCGPPLVCTSRSVARPPPPRCSPAPTPAPASAPATARTSSRRPSSRVRSATFSPKRAPSSRSEPRPPAADADADAHTTAAVTTPTPHCYRRRRRRHMQVFDLSAEQPLEYYAVFNQYQVRLLSRLLCPFPIPTHRCPRPCLTAHLHASPTPPPPRLTLAKEHDRERGGDLPPEGGHHAQAALRYMRDGERQRQLILGGHTTHNTHAHTY